MARLALALASLLLAALFALPVSAAPIEAGVTYRLHSHPDGGLRPPLYGLRLDGLDGDERHDFTFGFDEPGSAMTMRWDGSDLHIRGTAFGGRDKGSHWRKPQHWEIDFAYRDVQVRGDQLIAHEGSGTGHITATRSRGGFDAGERFELVDFAGKHDFSFALRSGHRGFDGLSGLGWLNHSGFDLAKHVYASDWLFTVGAPVPEPGAALLFGLGALVVAGRRRR